jgi:glyoxylase-like metal-dependent hydrolase (beta-lactamase superfamily II)
MSLPVWLRFFERSFPSGNMVLINGPRAVLVDSGFGSDADATEALLFEAGTPPDALTLIVNTHYHSDHVGGNHRLQTRYSVPVAAHGWEAALVNARDPGRLRGRLARPAVESYQVDRCCPTATWSTRASIPFQVIHTPGHTLGHIALFDPDSGVLIGGDLLQAGDVAWLKPFGEGADCLQQALASLDRLAALPVRVVCPGHGPVLDNAAAVIDTARRRYDRWLADPAKGAWHACKRIFAYALMIRDGLSAAEVAPYLGGCPWFVAYSRDVFGQEPADFVTPLVDEMVRAGAAAWREGAWSPPRPTRPPPPAGRMVPSNPLPGRLPCPPTGRAIANEEMPMTQGQGADLIVTGAAEVLTMAGGPGPRRGPHQAELGLVADGRWPSAATPSWPWGRAPPSWPPTRGRPPA